MPSTVNGIGTHYYGRSNLTTHQGQCRSCGRIGNLTSYDTRLFFVFVFIPVIPLGRKRILDQCSACKRHYVMKLHEWETQRQLNVSGSMDEYRRNPGVDQAMAAHNTLVNFRQLEEADTFRQEILSVFPESARLHLHLAAADHLHGKATRGDDSVRKAFSLRPDLPEVRLAMAAVHRREGALDEARTMLDILEKPGAGQLYPLGELEELAYAYQKNQRHQEAWELMGQLIRELPAAGQHPEFRRKVKLTEKALGKGDSSLLPKPDNSLKGLMSRKNPRRWILAGTAAAALAICLVARNEYTRRHRTLMVVNGFQEPVKVSIDGGGFLTIPARGRESLQLPEGHYKAVVEGPLTETIEFDLATEYTARWTKSPAFVLIPGGTFPLQYLLSPYGETSVQAEQRLILGERFAYLPDVDHLFKDLPEKISLKRGESKILTSLNRINAPVEQVVAAIWNEKGAEAGQRAAASALLAAPDNEDLLSAYRALAAGTPAEAEALRYLTGGLSHRPVRVRWHRTWQDLHTTPEGRQEVRSYYQQLLAAEPGNADLCYLAGRALDDSPEAMALFEEGLRLDSGNPWINFALGYNRLELGDWAEARLLFQKATDKIPGDQRFTEALFQARLGAGEALTLIKDRQLTSILNVDGLLRRREAMAAAGLIQEGDAAEIQLQILLEKEGYSMEMRQFHRFNWLYMTGQWVSLRAAAGKDRTDAGKLAHYWIHLQEGRLDEAALLAAELKLENHVQHQMAQGLAAQVFGDAGKAASAFAACKKSLESSGGSAQRAAALLGQSEPVTQEQLDAISMDTESKALLCAILAGLHPEQRPLLLEQARRFRIHSAFPAGIIKLALQK